MTVPEKDTLLGTESKLFGVVGAQVGPHCTPKSSKEGIVGFGAKESLKRGHIVNDFRWETIYKKHSRKECFIPIFQRHGCMGKESDAHFNYMSVLSLSRAILLVCMGAGHMVFYTYTLKKGV
jgi:hypothetical protein